MNELRRDYLRAVERAKADRMDMALAWLSTLMFVGAVLLWVWAFLGH